MRNGTMLLDTVVVDAAIDSGLLHERQQLRTLRCRRLFAAVGTADSIWLTSRWFPLSGRSDSVSGCAARVRRAGAWGSLLHGMSPIADTQWRTDSSATCVAVAEVEEREAEAALTKVLTDVVTFLRSEYPSVRRDSSAVIEMLT